MLQKEDIDCLRKYIEATGTNVSDEMFNDLVSRVEMISLKKSTILEECSDVWNVIGLVKSGLIRTYYYKNDKEVTEGFIGEGRTFTSVESFFMQRKTNVFVEAETDVVYYRAKLEDIAELCHKYQDFDEFFLRAMLATIEMINVYAQIIQLESADEKYEVFCRQFADVVLRVPSVHIASCLGITPETLSRVRGRRYKS